MNQNPFDTTEKSTVDSPLTISGKEIQKTAKATDDLVLAGINIAGKTTKAATKNTYEDKKALLMPQPMPKEFYIQLENGSRLLMYF